MKKINLIPLILFAIFFLCSCRNKTVVLLTKKWDCVKVDNIVPPDTKFLSSKDSANAEQLKSVLQSVSWTFKNNMQYECAIGNRVTVEGKYQLLENDKIMICTSESGNSINRYIINTLSENELVLRGRAENANLILHFRSNQ